MIVLLSCWGGPAMAQDGADAGDELPFRFGDFTAKISDLADPSAVAITHDNRIVIVQRAQHRITICDRLGKRLRSFGAFGRGPGQLAFPEGVAIFGRGDGAQIVVADTGNHRVQFFSMNGQFIRGWGAFGRDKGQFNRPTGITVDEDRVYVADTGNDRVQMLNHDGTVLLTLDGSTAEDVPFNQPGDIAVGPQRRMYVADTGRNRICVFEADGAFVRSFGDWGPFIGLMDHPSAVTVRDERVYVTDTLNHRVQVFTLNGQTVYQWGIHARYPREAGGKLHYPGDLAIAPDGSFAVLCESFENRCQLFEVAPDDVSEAQSGSPMQPMPEQTHFGKRLSIAGNLLAIGEPETHSVYVFRIDREVPIMVTKISGRGTAAHQFMRLAGLELSVDPVELLVADTALNRLQQFAIPYDRHETLRFRPFISKLLRAFDLAYFSNQAPAAERRWTIEPATIEHGPNGNLWIVDTRNAMVHEFDLQMQHVRTIGDVGGRRQSLAWPSDLAFSNDSERVYVVDRGDRRVKVYDRAGMFLFAFDAAESESGAFAEPFGVAVAADGSVYVTDMAGHRVVKCDPRGNVVLEWGEQGADDGQFWKPADIEQAADGRLFIADYGNHRAQVFNTDGQWLVRFGLGRSATRTTRELDRREMEEVQ